MPLQDADGNTDYVMNEVNKLSVQVSCPPSVTAVGGLRPRQLTLISEKSRSLVRDREARSRKGQTQEAERASSIPIILSPNLRLTKVQEDVRIKNWTLQPPPSL